MGRVDQVPALVCWYRNVKREGNGLKEKKTNFQTGLVA